MNSSRAPRASSLDRLLTAASRFAPIFIMALSLAFAASPVQASEGTHSPERLCEAALLTTGTQTPPPQDSFVIDPARQALRQSLIMQYADLILADENQNQIWIDEALDPHASASIHVLIENAWIKLLNDKIIKNKDLVTALTNFHKVLFTEELAKSGVKTKFAAYHDFKSIRLTLDASTGPNDLKALEHAFHQAGTRFYNDSTLRQILRAQDLKENWFRMGIGHSEAEAALAARYARDGQVEQDFAYFWDQGLQTRLDEKFRQIQLMHTQILNRLRGSKLIERNGRITTLSLDVFAAARKATAKDFLETLREIFPHDDLDQDIAQLILRFTNMADEFSPSVLVAKRELLTIHEAPFGAISIDFIGLGAENLRGTVLALLRSKDLGEAVKLTRVNERKVTLEFENRKKMVEAAALEQFGGAVSVRFSGDDGIIIPYKEFFLREQIMLVGHLSSLMAKPYFRMAVIGAEAALGHDSSQLITHGESMEKILRRMILRDLGPQRSNEISLQLFIPDAGANRKVYLLIGAKSKLSAVEQRKLKSLFPTAVKMVQEQANQLGITVDYTPNEIFAIYGWKKKIKPEGRR